MHVGIAYPRWRGKRSQHSRRMRIRNFTYLVRGPWTTTRTFQTQAVFHLQDIMMAASLDTVCACVHTTQGFSQSSNNQTNYLTMISWPKTLHSYFRSLVKLWWSKYINYTHIDRSFQKEKHFQKYAMIHYMCTELRCTCTSISPRHDPYFSCLRL